MKRHYFQKRLRGQLDQLAPLSPSVWELSPYEVARFGGELSKVMVEAAQRYISEQSVIKQQSLFETTAFRDKSEHQG